ncbi:hypothetical protein [Arsenophonus endosymbiont of Crataerina pallida]|uniref:hypothetical protein n=1 Tax=Arsenophonus endosymbiont of Crataerina pallida TaxID=3066235 RepID=UPI003BAF2C45
MGKTISLALCGLLCWKHPHERGEDSNLFDEEISDRKHPHERGEDPIYCKRTRH